MAVRSSSIVTVVVSCRPVGVHSYNMIRLSPSVQITSLAATHGKIYSVGPRQVPPGISHNIIYFAAQPARDLSPTNLLLTAVEANHPLD